MTMTPRRRFLLLSAALAAAPLANSIAASALAQSDGATGGYYSPAQIDALLAPIALYPDELLAQTLMATTFKDDLVQAWAWVQDPANKSITPDAMGPLLANKAWDPSVKSLVQFPQVLGMLNSRLDWVDQIAYAMNTQQTDVWDGVQRLRRQAQAAGNLKSTPQQTVRTENGNIIIAPAQNNVVYLPSYNPIYVYGDWLYPTYPPVYLYYPPGYAVATAAAVGIAFGLAIAINGGYWGWCSPRWGYGGIYVNVNRYNSINVNRPPINNPNWRPGGPGHGGGRPPGGPVGRPGGPTTLPAHRPETRPTTGPSHRPETRPAPQPAHRPEPRPYGSPSSGFSGGSRPAGPSARPAGGRPAGGARGPRG
jgi:hypothetical protein